MRVNHEARAAAAESRRAQTRARLIKAAMTVIADKGPEAASIEDFVAAAGVSRGTFYNYFPTFEDLLHALNTETSEALDKTLEPIRSGIDDPAVLLALVLHRVMASFVADPVRGWLSLKIESTPIPRQAVFEARFDAIYKAAVASGRFRDCEVAAARNLAFGAFRMGLRDLVLGAVGPDHAVDLVSLILIAFGVTPDESTKISREAFSAARAATRRPE
ncbi:TetR/AcrR family transcriptional regulator [Phenylobacterium sp.]|uniref:TetR/AcrR family transcriptional regulator n=1 Tax=Phenylobacterium sp. TaxID=1871053 RepID=UPI0027275055|nr:TetR/AcrR family transcriptional regulator [Phenylobacterium sp.]MDO8802016.1 TetR/AcrR family transcriptional regulator [Phenylobacterium sp.]